MAEVKTREDIESLFLDSTERIRDTLAKHAPMASAEEAATIAIMIDKKNPMDLRIRARNKLVRSHSRMIFSIAMQYARKNGKPVEDLYQAGMLGAFMKAMEYDPKMNVKFTSFVVWNVRCKILEEIGFMNDLVHCSRNKRDLFTTKKGREAIMNSDKPEDIAFRRANRAPLSLYESVNKDGNQTDDGRLLWIDTIGTEDENLETIFNSSEDVGLGDLIHRAIDAKEFDIIRNSLLNGFNDKEVGEMVNRSSERIRQRRDRAMKKIAQEIKKEQKRNGYVYNNNVDTCRIDRVFSK